MIPRRNYRIEEKTNQPIWILKPILPFPVVGATFHRGPPAFRKVEKVSH